MEKEERISHKTVTVKPRGKVFIKFIIIGFLFSFFAIAMFNLFNPDEDVALIILIITLIASLTIAIVTTPGKEVIKKLSEEEQFKSDIKTDLIFYANGTRHGIKNIDGHMTLFTQIKNQSIKRKILSFASSKESEEILEPRILSDGYKVKHRNWTQFSMQLDDNTTLNFKTNTHKGKELNEKYLKIQHFLKVDDK